MQFPDYGTELWSPCSRNGSRKAGKHCDFSTCVTKRARAQFVVRAEMNFRDYGTVLWAHGSRNYSRKHRDLSTVLPRERELSLTHAQRSSFPIMEQI
jgi:hypothetical protein